MSNPTKAAEDLKGFANRFRAILEVADLLEKLGSLQQAERDAVIKKDAAYAAADAAVAKLSGLQAQIASLERALEEAQAKGKVMEQGAQFKAQQILAAAEAEAKEVIAAATKHRVEVDAAAKEALKELALVNSAVATKREEQAQVEKEVSALKAKIAALVKG